MISYRKFFKKTGYPEKFIAVDMSSEEMSGILQLYTDKPGPALFNFLKSITGNSVFFFTDGDTSFRQILRRLMRYG
jgi:hypothetical protein